MSDDAPKIMSAPLQPSARLSLALALALALPRGHDLCVRTRRGDRPTDRAEADGCVCVCVVRVERQLKHVVPQAALTFLIHNLFISLDIHVRCHRWPSLVSCSLRGPRRLFVLLRLWLTQLCSKRIPLRLRPPRLTPRVQIPLATILDRQTDTTFVHLAYLFDPERL